MRFAVYCGSSTGVEPQFIEHTIKFAQLLGQHGINLVYGGGKVGLMGALADTAIASGVHVIGIIPEQLVAKELANHHINELIVVENMHQRKAKMMEYADAFVALPGGTGTLEEIFEAWTWAQLGLHYKPCAFLNVNGYYDGLIRFLQEMVKAGFMQQSYLDMLIISEDIQQLLTQIKAYTPPKPKWTK